MNLSELTYDHQCMNIDGNEDCNYFFTINSRYSGYTYSKEIFHVLDHNTDQYTSYLSPAAFQLFLNNMGKDDMTNQTNGGILDDVTFDYPGGFPWLPVGIGAALIIGLLIFAK